MAKPKLIVFDLDYTLWPFWVDTHVDPPFMKKKDGTIKDVRGQRISCYPDVPVMLKKLDKEGYKLGLASRTSFPKGAEDLVRLFSWENYFEYKEIYPGCKINHFKKFHKDSGIEFKDMLFFDDEPRNIRDIESLGVTCILADDGMNEKVLEEGLNKFASTSGS